MSVLIPVATSDYRQSLQFQNLNEEKRNIHLEVCVITEVVSWLYVMSFLHVLIIFAYGIQVIRGGRRIEVSIFDIVAGDIVPLKIGDQVG